MEGTGAHLHRDKEKAETLATRLYNFVVHGTVMKLSRGLCLSCITLSGIIFLSIFLYGTFYYIYIPQSTMRRPLHFYKTSITKYREVQDGQAMQHAAITTNVLHVEVPVTLAGNAPFLRPGQSYSFLLELHMPDSNVNHDAGTFMINSNYYDKEEKLLTSSSRLVMIRYRSWLLRTLDTLVFSPLYLLGIFEESQLRKIELFQNYRESTFSPTAIITIDIDNADLHLYDCALTVRINFSGLRYLMYYWPMTTSVLGAGLIAFLLLLVACSSWLTFSTNRTSTIPHQSVLSEPVSEMAESDSRIEPESIGQITPSDSSPVKHDVDETSAHGDGTTDSGDAKASARFDTDGTDSGDNPLSAHTPTRVRHRKPF